MWLQIQVYKGLIQYKAGNVIVISEAAGAIDLIGQHFKCL